MNWKNRQMFSDREHGIVSGLSPINMMGGGSVPIPGYQNGGIAGGIAAGPYDPLTDTSEPITLPYNPALFEGDEKPSINDEVAELATKMGISIPQARAMVLNRMIKQRGLTLSPDIVNQFAVGLISLHDALAQALGPPKPIPGMQGGGLAMDLFEEGDQEINEALNMMSGSVSPPLSDIGPTAPTGPMLEETIDEETAIMDQGSGEYQVELQGIKKQFEELLRRYAAKLAEANGTIEQLIEQAKSVEIAFSNKVAEIQAKHNIEGLDETLLTEEFMQELTALIDPTIPGMQNAGVVHSREELIAAQKLLSELGMNMSPQRFLNLPEDQRKKYINAFTILAANRGTTSSSVGDRTKLDQLLKDRKALAGQIGEAARSSHSSYLPRILHHGAAKSVGELAEAGAMDKILADQIATEGALLSAGGSGASSMGRLPAALIEDIYGKTSDLSAAYENMIDALKKGGKQADLGLVDVMFMERYQQMPPDQTAYQGTKTIQDQTVSFPQFYARTRNQIINKLDKEPSITYEARKIDALRRIFTLWINQAG